MFLWRWRNTEKCLSREIELTVLRRSFCVRAVLDHRTTARIQLQERNREVRTRIFDSISAADTGKHHSRLTHASPRVRSRVSLDFRLADTRATLPKSGVTR